MARRVAALLSIALVVALALSGCGGGGAEPTGSRASTVAPPAAEGATKVPSAEATRVSPTAAPPTAAGQTAAPTAAQAAQKTPTVASGLTGTPAIAAQNDGGSKADAPNAIAQALAAKAGVSVSGSLAEDDPDDWYVLPVAAGSVVDLTFGPTTGGTGMSVEFFDADEYSLWAEYGIDTGTKTFRWVVSGADGGDYYVHVSAGEGPYEWKAAIAPQDDGGSGGDAGPEREEGVAIALDAAFTGLVGDSDSDDWYYFGVPGGSVLRVELLPAEGDDLNVTLQDPDAYDLWTEYEVSARRGGASVSRLIPKEAGGEYAVAVTGTGAYTVEVSAKGQDDAGSGGDAPGDMGEAIEAPVGEPFTGIIGDSDDSDWFTFDVPEGSVLTVSLTTDAGSDDVTVALYDPDEYDLWSAYDVQDAVTVTSTSVIGPGKGGMHALEVAGGPATYTVEITVAAQDDAGSGADAGDDIAGAVEIAVGPEEYGGVQGGTDSADWYMFTLEAGQKVTITLKVAGTEEKFYLAVYDADENEIESVYDIDSRRDASIALADGEAGDYYVEVGEGAGAYTLTITEGVQTAA